MMASAMGFEFHNVSRVMQSGSGRAFGSYQSALRQPSWAMRAAWLTFFIVIGIPILLLVIVAGLAALTVVLVLSLVAATVGWFQRTLGLTPQEPMSGEDEGRENVRVIRRD